HQLATDAPTPHHHRRHHSALADRRGQRRQRLVGEHAPRLLRVRSDGPDGNLQQPGLLGRPRDQRRQPSTKPASSHSRLLRPNTLSFFLSSGGGSSRGSITSGSSPASGTSPPGPSPRSPVRSSTSRARARYDLAPFEPESYSVMGLPYPGASDRRTVRGMTVSYTRFPKYFR